MRAIACGALLACAFVALAGPASAQTSTASTQPTQSSYVERTTPEGQDIRFPDDPLGAIANDPIGAQLSGFHPPKRYDLLRPRTTFVPQMLKSIENI
jgi:hypothetical protein